MLNYSSLKGFRKYLLYSAVIIPVAILIYFLRYQGLAKQDVFIPLINMEPPLRIPPRPGINGIVLSGPILKELKFEINANAAGLKPLDWHDLADIDRTASVMVLATVGADGYLNNLQIQDRGHPGAGRYIGKVLATWVYTTYKTGPIRFYFNMASTGNQLVIEKHNLILSNPAGNPIVDGQLYYATGSSAGRVGYGTITGN